METNFINYHVLISHSPSCLNRDDMNMQKTAIFGGVRRVRISSQSLKYAMRQGAYFREKFGGTSIRTRTLDLLKTRLQEVFAGKYDPEIIAKAVDRWIAKDEKSLASGDGVAVAPWCIGEIGEFIKMIQEKPDLNEKDFKKMMEKRSESLSHALESAIDIALFGRMSTAEIMIPVDGSLAVAHAVTTHQVEADIDWFTAVDELVADAGETGAGHLNTQEFSAGVFYRYASLNIGQLQKNLGNVSREKALDVAKELFYLLATTVPQAKQQPFAAFNRADFAMVSFSDQPISLANAFEQPIKADRAGGYLEPSIKKFMEYWNNVYSAYELSDKTIVLDVQKVAKTAVPTEMNCNFRTKISEIKDWIQQGGR